MRPALFISLAFTLSLQALLIVGSSLPGQAQAQNLYRCGSTYQDKPCDGGQGQMIKKNPSPSTSDKPPLDANCVRRGEEAKKMIWYKEGGALQDRMLSEAKTAEQRRIVADVYAMKGNANDVRMKIESDCMAEKEAERKFGPRASEDEASRHQAAERKAVTGENSKDSSKPDPAEAARKQKQCDELRKQINALRNAQKAGGTALDMETQANNKRDTETSLKELGCTK
ncbi:hypothetical protein UNDYM_1607 [Undibacterium sp. YM2]|uniref:hypothetical protein n=1 Tax=Undibacterium sp. YM2 TaxID=2058625 RepID=UPI001331F890|nr:hypothetical protein [Undibacterium sp. YM2]BBB65860.1 hypothetical protein UNDYM_1607 [Undibacterium sp. YM2]